MDDLRSTLRDFDADAPDARPRSVGLDAGTRGQDRAAVGHGGDDRGRARPSRIASPPA